ncbi:hypothetical protein [Gephyromycinifex aptenodytis]|uniref:hypothetical protein n=1 Tax=Gephyromycinifex aptenodytis TaxID=2716227 RepID=UPI00144588D5|nr:hypothetical protein [Gephyromycinifex aptenodytis]
MSDAGVPGSAHHDGSREAARSALSSELNDLAGAWGAPGAVQHAVEHLPDAATADVAHDFSVTLGLLLGDLAEVIQIEARRSHDAPGAGGAGYPAAATCGSGAQDENTSPAGDAATGSGPGQRGPA